MLAFIFLITGATTSITFTPVSLSRYADLFVITQYPSVNVYLVTNNLYLTLITKEGYFSKFK